MDNNVSELQRFPIEITVHGVAQPAGSKRAIPLGGKNATGRWGVADANKKAEPWKAQVAQSAGIQYLGSILRGPLRVEMVFYKQRPKGHYGTGRNAEILKDSAPSYPESKPDALKYARGVEDALTGIVWMDDAQIVDEYIAKRYGTPRVEIRIWAADFVTVGDQVRAGVVEVAAPTEQFEQLALTG